MVDWDGIVNVIRRHPAAASIKNLWIFLQQPSLSKHKTANVVLMAKIPGTRHACNMGRLFVLRFGKRCGSCGRRDLSSQVSTLKKLKY
jgi:hypothetical protein